MNTVEVVFPDHVHIAEASDTLWQWDYGQRLLIRGVALPSIYEVHFCNAGDDKAKMCAGDSTGVIIPDEYLKTGRNILAFVFLHDGEDDGETMYRIVIKVKQRPQPTDDPITEEEGQTFHYAIKKLQEFADLTREFDTEPVEGGENLITSGGVYEALQGKQDVLVLDTEPVAESGNPITSGAVAAALEDVQSKLTLDDVPIEGSHNPVSSGGVYEALGHIEETLAAPDWGEGDDSSPAYIKNKTHYLQMYKPAEDDYPEDWGESDGRFINNHFTAFCIYPNMEAGQSCPYKSSIHPDYPVIYTKVVDRFTSVLRGQIRCHLEYCGKHGEFAVVEAYDDTTDPSVLNWKIHRYIDATAIDLIYEYFFDKSIGKYVEVFYSRESLSGPIKGYFNEDYITKLNKLSNIYLDLADEPIEHRYAPITSDAVYRAMNNMRVPVDDSLSDISENPVQNKVILSALRKIMIRVKSLEDRVEDYQNGFDSNYNLSLDAAEVDEDGYIVIDNESEIYVDDDGYVVLIDENESVELENAEVDEDGYIVFDFDEFDANVDEDGILTI